MGSELPSPVQQFIDATNRGDVAAFLACFSPKAVIDDWGREYWGESAIAEWSEHEFIGVRTTLDVTDLDVVSGGVVVTARVSGNGFNGPSQFAFQLENNRVSRMTVRG